MYIKYIYVFMLVAAWGCSKNEQYVATTAASNGSVSLGILPDEVKGGTELKIPYVYNPPKGSEVRIASVSLFIDGVETAAKSGDGYIVWSIPKVDQQKRLRISAVDSAGGQMESNEKKVTVDSTPPLLPDLMSATKDSFTPDAQLGISKCGEENTMLIKVTENGPMSTDPSFACKAQGLFSWSLLDDFPQLSPTTDQFYRYKIYAMDRVGNVSLDSRDFSIHYIANGPKIRFLNENYSGKSFKGGTALTISWENERSDLLSDLQYTLFARANSQDAWTLVSDKISAISGKASYVYTTPTSGDGKEFQFQVTSKVSLGGRLVDIAGLSQTFVLDNTGPVITDVKFNPVLIRDPLNPYPILVNKDFTISVQGNEPGSFAALVSVDQVSPDAPVTGYTPFGSVQSKTLGASKISPVKVYIFARDTLGNTSKSEPQIVDYESELPETPVVELLTKMPTSGKDAQIKIVDCKKAPYVNYSISQLADKNFIQESQLPCVEGKTIVVDIGALSDNSYKVTIQGRSFGGRLSAVSDVKNVVIDRTAPTIVINKPSETMVFSRSGKKTIDLDWIATDVNLDAAKNLVIEYRTSRGQDKWLKLSDAEPSAGVKSWDVSGLEDTSELEIRFSVKDVAGNAQSVLSTPQTIDNTAPTIVSVIPYYKKKTGEFALLQNQKIAMPFVYLDVVAEDKGSGVSQMQVRDGFPDPLESSWRSAVPDSGGKIPRTGFSIGFKDNKPVFFIKDKAGNVASMKFNAEVDFGKFPEIKFLSPAAGVNLQGSWDGIIKASVNDVDSGIEEGSVSIFYSNDAKKTWQKLASGLTPRNKEIAFSWALPADPGAFFFAISASDRAGNMIVKHSPLFNATSVRHLAGASFSKIAVGAGASREEVLVSGLTTNLYTSESAPHIVRDPMSNDIVLSEGVGPLLMSGQTGLIGLIPRIGAGEIVKRTTRDDWGNIYTCNASGVYILKTDSQGVKSWKTALSFSGTISSGCEDIKAVPNRPGELYWISHLLGRDGKLFKHPSLSQDPEKLVFNAEEIVHVAFNGKSLTKDDHETNESFGLGSRYNSEMGRPAKEVSSPRRNHIAMLGVGYDGSVYLSDFCGQDSKYRNECTGVLNAQGVGAPYTNVRVIKVDQKMDRVYVVADGRYVQAWTNPDSGEVSFLNNCSLDQDPYTKDFFLYLGVNAYHVPFDGNKAPVNCDTLSGRSDKTVFAGLADNYGLGGPAVDAFLNGLSAINVGSTGALDPMERNTIYPSVSHFIKNKSNYVAYSLRESVNPDEPVQYAVKDSLGNPVVERYTVAPGCILPANCPLSTTPNTGPAGGVFHHYFGKLYRGAKEEITLFNQAVPGSQNCFDDMVNADLENLGPLSRYKFLRSMQVVYFSPDNYMYFTSIQHAGPTEFGCGGGKDLRVFRAPIGTWKNPSMSAGNIEHLAGAGGLVQSIEKVSSPDNMGSINGVVDAKSQRLLAPFIRVRALNDKSIILGTKQHLVRLWQDQSGAWKMNRLFSFNASVVNFEVKPDGLGGDYVYAIIDGGYQGKRLVRVHLKSLVDYTENAMTEIQIPGLKFTDSFKLGSMLSIRPTGEIVFGLFDGGYGSVYQYKE